MPKFLLLMTPVLLVSALYSAAGIHGRIPSRPPVVTTGREMCEKTRACPGSEEEHALQRTDAAGGPALRVVSYNVHKCTGMDARRDPSRIAEVIRSLGADIVSLQEVLSDPGDVPSAQVRYLARKTGMYAVAAPTKRKKDGLYGNALLSRFPISEVRLHDISVGSSEPRGVIEADIEIGGRTVRVVATHLGLWPRERSRQADRLLEILAARPSSHLIVMGDMNGWVPGSPVLTRLSARLGPAASVRSFPAAFPVLPLDKVWVLPKDGLQRIDVYSSALARTASDHLPVVADVSLGTVLHRPLIAESLEISASSSR